MTAFYNVPPHGDIDDLIFDELDYEISRRELSARIQTAHAVCRFASLQMVFFRV